MSTANKYMYMNATRQFSQAQFKEDVNSVSIRLEKRRGKNRDRQKML